MSENNDAVNAGNEPRGHFIKQFIANDLAEGKNGGIVVTGYKGKDTKLYIPPVLDGKKVTTIDSCAFDHNYYFEYVSIPHGVTHIGESAIEETAKKYNWEKIF